MKKIIPLGSAMILAAVCMGCSQENGSNGNNGFVEKAKSYCNPVFNQDSPDPSVMRGDDGNFYAFTTAGLRRSEDLVNWSALKDPFESRPSWSDICHDVWAMDVNKIGDKYVL
ncbi:MAG: family 43 glycosylhydrolase, partial [Muribaculaceae bacterium]|nr:family 43 glycosylhydrolase [Muribaculaceae bacterium]